MMFVYVLHVTWSNPDDEGSWIKVFAEEHLENARAEMRANANQIKACYRDAVSGKEPWEDDYTWESDDDIQLGFCDKPFGLATIYSWVISHEEVQ